ncbi:MAG: YgfZ/GcvT domain-containing protein [Pseudohongiellaceae bacterium]
MQVIDLNTFEFIRASGSDKIQFLQGQTTCDIEALTESKSLSGAICNQKGRVVADFQIALHRNDCVLRTTGGTAEAILTTLSKYAVFSNVKLKIDTEVIRAFGFIGDDAEIFLNSRFQSLPAEIGNCIAVPGGLLLRIPSHTPRFELWCNDADLIAEIGKNVEANSNLDKWYREDMKAGIMHVDSDAVEKYTPQLLNFDISGVVDFNKGCYTGQEVVARMFYRGNPKKRLYLLTSEHPVKASDELLQIEDENTKPAEVMIVSNRPADSTESSLVLAILDTSAVENQANFVFANKSESYLQIQSLPYTT